MGAYAPGERLRITAVLAAAVVLVAVSAAVITQAASRSGDGGGAPAAANQRRTVAVELGDLYVKPSALTLAEGTDLTLEVVNKGAIEHDLAVAGGEPKTPLLRPGARAILHVGVVRPTIKLWCTVPGHKDAGMVLTVKVKGAGEVATGAATGPAESRPAVDPNAKPAADWKPLDPALQPAPGATEHRITIEATETVLEVAPGIRQEMWTFNGRVPGPTLRGKVGDLFTVTLVNKGKLGHSIDFHASKVAWNDEMRTIQPGESLVYRFVAKHAGIYMYHCGTAPTLHHIGNGMYGAIIIDPPNLPPVDHEYVLVQSELYFGVKGGPGELSRMLAEQWDAVVFNGYWNQYRFAPIRVEPNQRVRVWVLDAGPSENAAFHVVGTIFDTVWKEGTYLLRPDDRRGGSQVLDLQPAQGGFVEFTFDEVGLYPIVTHKFASASKGALGLFQAGEVTTTSSGGH
ncbi:MAG: nitrite reductase [Acidimicrobiia bacterium]